MYMIHCTLPGMSTMTYFALDLCGVKVCCDGTVTTDL